MTNANDSLESSKFLSTVLLDLINDGMQILVELQRDVFRIQLNIYDAFSRCFRKKEDGDLSKEWFASVLNNTQYSSGKYNV